MATNSYNDMMDILGDQARLEGLFHENPDEFSALMRNILRYSNRGPSPVNGSTPTLESDPQEPETLTGTLGKSEKHPDPPIFNGDPIKWREFKTQLRVKLQVNRDRYKDSQSRLAYTVSRLQGNPLNIIQPKILNGKISFIDFEDLLSYLDIAYQDPDLMVKAQRDLRDLKQRNREFYLYFADFQRIIEDTGITDNEARKSALMGGLSTELLGLLVHHDIPTKFEDLVKLLQNLDSRFRLNHSRTQGFQFTKPNIGFSRPTRPVTRDNNRLFTPRPRNASLSTEPSSSTGDPMDLSTATRQRLSPSELNRRIQEGLCRYCGQPGHYAKECPISKANKRSTGREATGRESKGYRLSSSQNEIKDLGLPARNLPSKSKNARSLF